MEDLQKFFLELRMEMKQYFVYRARKIVLSPLHIMELMVSLKRYEFKNPFTQKVKIGFEKLFLVWEAKNIYEYRECVTTGAAGAQTRRSLGHDLLHPLILRLLELCAPADFEAQGSLL